MSKYKSLTVIILMFCFSAFAQNESSKENIIFIIVDDLRDLVMADNQLEIITPNIDKLKKRGVNFKNSFTNNPTCGASRASILTGLRPTKSRFRNYDTKINKDAPNALTIASYLKKNGYRTISNGKISHFSKDAAYGWDDMFRSPRSNPKDYKDTLNIKNLKNNFGPASEFIYADDNDYSDGKVTQKTLRDIQSINNDDKPYFIAVGFQKPHLPFIAPKKYWDLYQRNDFSMPSNKAIPPGYPIYAANPRAAEMQRYSDYEGESPKDFPEETNRRLLHGYAAATSYADACVGRILDALDKNGHAENTVVVLWGDHGWKLGDHSSWCKHTNFECDTRVPLIVRDPRHEGGQKTNRLVELIDLYPTLCELTGLPVPEHCQGRSFKTLLSEWFVVR